MYSSLPNAGVWTSEDPGTTNGERTKFKNKLDQLFGIKGEWVKR